MDRRLADALIFFGLGIFSVGSLVIVSATELNMHVELGIGTVIVGAFDAKEAAEILEVPEGYCAVAMTPLGYPAEEGRPPNRKELSEITFEDKFGVL